MTDKKKLLRALPSVDVVLKEPDVAALAGQYGHDRVTRAVRDCLATCRQAVLDEAAVDPSSLAPNAVLAAAEEALRAASRPFLRRVVNATGIVLHTGLGRAVMPPAARDALAQLTGCCNIQLDLDEGGRIRREAAIRSLVQELTGARDAVLVNNNAGATMLVLRALCKGREAVVSRGELIEIGGSFRLPDVMSESGAVLKEIGATNKTHPRDYENAVGANTGLLMKVHKSNYCIEGFAQEVSIGDIAEIGKRHGVPVVDDLGCGAVVDLAPYGLAHEPTIRESLAAGSDVVLSSTDKLIGGPQGGLIVGRSDLLKQIRSCPLYRALRVGKMTLAALEATLRLFLSPERLAHDHPTYMMLAKTRDEMKAQADKLAADIRAIQPDWQVDVVADDSHLGGGSLPGSVLPASAVRIRADSSCDALTRDLRSAEVPVIPYVKDKSVRLNMRTVLSTELEDVVAAIRTIGWS